MWIRLENEEQRRERCKKRSNLKGKKERIVEDLIWKERKMRGTGGNRERVGEKRKQGENRL